MFKFYQVFSEVHVKFKFYQICSGDYVKLRIYQVFSGVQTQSYQDFSGVHVKFRLYQVFRGIHVKFIFYQVFSGGHVMFRFYQVFSGVQTQSYLTLCLNGGTTLPGFFSPFPHGTCSLSVIREYLALEGGPPIFKQRFTCAALLNFT